MSMHKTYKVPFQCPRSTIMVAYRLDLHGLPSYVGFLIQAGDVTWFTVLGLREFCFRMASQHRLSEEAFGWWHGSLNHSIRIVTILLHRAYQGQRDQAVEW